MLAQTWGDLELIVVDDGSSDETAQVVKEYTDNRLRYLRLEDNRGPAFARNRGVEAAQGEYIAFQDSDDEWLQHKLSRQMKVMLARAPDVSVVYSDMLRVSEDGTTSYFPAPEVVQAEPINHSTHEFSAKCLGIVSVLMKKNCMDEAGLFDENLHRLEDMELLTRLSLRYRFYHIPEATVLYHGLKKTKSNSYNEGIALRLILEKYIEHADEDKRFLANQYFNISIALIKCCRFAEGRSYLLKALKCHPSQVISAALARGTNRIKLVLSAHLLTCIRRSR